MKEETQMMGEGSREERGKIEMAQKKKKTGVAGGEL